MGRDSGISDQHRTGPPSVVLAAAGAVSQIPSVRASGETLISRRVHQTGIGLPGRPSRRRPAGLIKRPFLVLWRATVRTSVSRRVSSREWGSFSVALGITMMVESPPASGLVELSHLSTFVRAAEEGSFTAAASALGITQAAVSQRIALLEKGLRVSLFDRRTGRIALTEAGQRLYQYARRILDLHEQARRDLGGFHPTVSGDLPIAASSVPGECFLPALLSAFHAKYPQVHVRATVSDSGSVIKEVEKGRASLGLIGQKAEKSALEVSSDRQGFPRAHRPRRGIPGRLVEASRSTPWSANRSSSAR